MSTAPGAGPARRVRIEARITPARPSAATVTGLARGCVTGAFGPVNACQIHTSSSPRNATSATATAANHPRAATRARASAVHAAEIPRDATIHQGATAGSRPAKGATAPSARPASAATSPPPSHTSIAGATKAATVHGSGCARPSSSSRIAPPAIAATPSPTPSQRRAGTATAARTVSAARDAVSGVHGPERVLGHTRSAVARASPPAMRAMPRTEGDGSVTRRRARIASPSHAEPASGGMSGRTLAPRPAANQTSPVAKQSRTSATSTGTNAHTLRSRETERPRIARPHSGAVSANR